jgi:iron(III) transport system permease protein
MTDTLTRSGKTSPRLVALASTVLVVTFIPLFYLVIRAAEKPAGEIADLLLRPRTVEIIATTAIILVAVVLINVLLGTLIAAGIHFVRLPYAHLLIIPMILPLAIPSYVFTYTWIALVPDLSGVVAAIFILVLTTLPYMMLSIVIALRRLDSGLIEVARTLGLSKTAILFRVVIPQIRGAISAGSLLSGLYVLSDFGAVSLLNVTTLTVSIQNLFKSTYDRSGAAIMALVLVAASTVFIALESGLKRRQETESATKKTGTKHLRISNPSARISLLVLVSAYTCAGVIAPISILLSRFFSNSAPIEWAELFSAGLSTVSIAAAGAGLALIFSIPLGMLVAQGSSRFALLSEKAVLISHALPGVVIGLALVSLGSKLGPLYQSVALLAFAYAILFLAKSVAAMNYSLQLISPSVKEAAATLGKSKGQIARTITFPIAFPSVALGTLLVFLTAMKELPATLMLRPIGMETLATQVWSYAAVSKFNEAAPYALLLIIIAAVPTFLLSLPREALDRPKNSVRDLQLGESR